MLHVRARAGLSKVHGIGPIATEFIPKGQNVREFVPGFDRILTQGDVDAMSPAAAEQVRWYAHHDDTDHGERVWVLSKDDDRFTNHGVDPNTETVHDPVAGSLQLAPSFAVRDIAPGEEITWKYRKCPGLNSDLALASVRST